METIERLTESIMADARMDVLQIETQTAEKLKQINQETDELVAAKRARIYRQAKQNQEELLQRMQAKRTLEATQQVLRCKQELLDETFVAAKEALRRISTVERKKLVVFLWRSVLTQLRTPKILAAPQEMRFFKGKTSQLEPLSQTTGGFIAESQDGTVRIDCRFETLFETVKLTKSAEIAAVLFEEKNTPKRSITAKKGQVKKAMMKKTKQGNRNA